MPALLGALLSALFGKIAGALTWIATLTTALVAAFWLLGTDLGAWLFEQVLDIVIAALNTLDFDADLFNPSNYISVLPQEIGNMLALLRLGECFAIIAGAVVLRLLLQLVPFTRLGS